MRNFFVAPTLITCLLNVKSKLFLTVTNRIFSCLVELVTTVAVKEDNQAKVHGVEQTYRHSDTKVDYHSVSYQVEVSADHIKNWPERHQVVNEIGVVELEVLVSFAHTRRSFECFTPIEQIAVFLRLD